MSLARRRALVNWLCREIAVDGPEAALVSVNSDHLSGLVTVKDNYLSPLTSDRPQIIWLLPTALYTPAHPQLILPPVSNISPLSPRRGLTLCLVHCSIKYFIPNSGLAARQSLRPNISPLAHAPFKYLHDTLKYFLPPFSLANALP